MGSESGSNNELSTTKIFSIHVTCIVPFCAKGEERDNSEGNRNASGQSKFPHLSPEMPKRIIKKIIKATNPSMCFKAMRPVESSPVLKQFVKKINKSMKYPWRKTKEQEDDRCLWKKTILMGEKCQPLQFSGSIFYDSNGNQLSHPPRSPRFTSSPLPTFDEFEM
ncbi:hypothetical protein Fmac_023931 [Flemingia macrophylla]|uniref:Uncharacterized protein n=1 Tax=Flemingia macrophylla TaxID=520843 RepID=A0ABD1LNG3_9FABA